MMDNCLIAQDILLECIKVICILSKIVEFILGCYDIAAVVIFALLVRDRTDALIGGVSRRNICLVMDTCLIPFGEDTVCVGEAVSVRRHDSLVARFLYHI